MMTSSLQVLFELLLGVSAHDPVPCYHGDTEGTDLVSFVEEFEGQISSVLIGQWQDDVGQGVWSLAECCIHDNRHTRPSSTEVDVQCMTVYTCRCCGVTVGSARVGWSCRVASLSAGLSEAAGPEQFTQPTQ